VTVLRWSPRQNLNFRRPQVKFGRLRLVKDSTKKATIPGTTQVTMLATMHMQRKIVWKRTFRLMWRTWATTCKIFPDGLRSSAWMSPSSPATATFALHTPTQRKTACGLSGLTTTAANTTCCSPLSWTRKSLTKFWAGLALKVARFRVHRRTCLMVLWLVNSSWRQPPTTSVCCSQEALAQSSTPLIGKRARNGAQPSISGEQKF